MAWLTSLWRCESDLSLQVKVERGGPTLLRQLSWTTSGKLLEAAMYYSLCVGNGRLCYKGKKSTRWGLRAFPCWAALKSFFSLYNMNSDPGAKGVPSTTKTSRLCRSNFLRKLEQEFLSNQSRSHLSCFFGIISYSSLKMALQGNKLWQTNERHEMTRSASQLCQLFLLFLLLQTHPF